MRLAAGSALVAPVLPAPFRRSQRLTRGGDPGRLPADLGPGCGAPGIPGTGVLPGIEGMLGTDRFPKIPLVDNEAFGMGRGDGRL